MSIPNSIIVYDNIPRNITVETRDIYVDGDNFLNRLRDLLEQFNYNEHSNFIEVGNVIMNVSQIESIHISYKTLKIYFTSGQNQTINVSDSELTKLKEILNLKKI